ncbi:hypothetical protein [Paenibacillus xylanexedens]|uniref:hypothetical protein n=1 Tax=Paenibacillus xylanexedens TaxID=528191 RepID=UPI000F54137B|nr:hypothetical protein [Paenibacillus xylanexedens]RPK20111.1 hypothetical protein EDO6_06650 [Paenibacillus xylanexedens]
MSKQNVQPDEALKITLQKFLQSNKSVYDHVELLLVAGKNAGNMSWNEIEKIVREVLRKEGEQ